jgi:hypothetical protein
MRSTLRITGQAATFALETLFVIREGAEKLDKECSNSFHSMVAKCQYLAILLPIVFLSSSVTAPDINDLDKLIRVIKHLNGSKYLGICIEPKHDGIVSVRAYVVFDTPGIQD